MTLSPATEGTPDAFTPWGLAEKIRDALELSPATRAEFELRLKEAGFEEHP